MEWWASTNMFVEIFHSLTNQDVRNNDISFIRDTFIRDIAYCLQQLRDISETNVRLLEFRDSSGNYPYKTD